MSVLDGFKVIELREKVEDTYLTITAKSLKLNRATARVLGLPKSVHFLINEKRMQIAIEAASAEDEDSVDFTFEDTGRDNPIYVKEPAVLKAVQKIAILEKNGTNLALTMKGLAYPEDKVIIFDLGEAVETIVKPRGRRGRPSDDKL